MRDRGSNDPTSRLGRSHITCRDMREKCGPEHRQLEVEELQEVSLCLIERPPWLGLRRLWTQGLGAIMRQGPLSLMSVRIVQSAGWAQTEP